MLARLGLRTRIFLLFAGLTAGLLAALGAGLTVGYRRLGEDKRIDWKEANETVNRIGGWRAYAREAQQPDSAASAPAGGAAPASAAGAAPAHGGHKKH